MTPCGVNRKNFITKRKKPAHKAGFLVYWFNTQKLNEWEAEEIFPTRNEKSVPTRNGPFSLK